MNDLESSEPIKSGLKTVEYEGFINKGEVVYKVKDKKILFSATRSSRKTTSTINAAEAVVIAISEAEGIDWKKPSFYEDYEFYDLTTPIGYPARKERDIFQLLAGYDQDEVELLKLDIKPRENYLHVVSWTKVNLTDRPDRRPSDLDTTLPSLPASILDGFASEK